MAQKKKRRPENVDGEFYVDSTCIDCDTCRWIAPEVFVDIADQSAVARQPTEAAERRRALQALVACPTASIGTMERAADLPEAVASFPELLDENVYYNGFHSEKSFGGASYLIVRPEGNVLVDSPRFAKPLVARIEALGGVATMLLTHRDDVADHELFARHFGCERVAHRREKLRGIERALDGEGTVEAAPGIQAIFTPGHTEGHLCYLYNNKFLFTGDHLAYSHRLHHLYAFRSACWYDWDELVHSMHRLADYRFEWVLPGHGRRHHADAVAMRAQMAKCLAWLAEGD